MNKQCLICSTPVDDGAGKVVASAVYCDNCEPGIESELWLRVAYSTPLTNLETAAVVREQFMSLSHRIAELERQLRTMSAKRRARPPFPYPGSTWTEVSKIAHLIPPPDSYDAYIEPFAGSCSVFLRLPVRPRMTVLNDINEEIVNLLLMIRDHPMELIGAIQRTPYSKSSLERGADQPPTPLNRAVAMYFRLAGTRYPFDSNPTVRRRNAVPHKKGGGGQSSSFASRFHNTDHLWSVSDMFRGVEFHSEDAIEFIERYVRADKHERTLIVADPPYLSSTRVRKNHYDGEDGDNTSFHTDIHRILSTAGGPVMLFGYQSDLYESLYESIGWQRHDYKSRIDGGKSKVESVWINPTLIDILAQDN